MRNVVTSRFVCAKCYDNGARLELDVTSDRVSVRRDRYFNKSFRLTSNLTLNTFEIFSNSPSEGLTFRVLRTL